MSVDCKPFSIQYTNKESGRVAVERPRVMITVDGKHKSLFVGESHVLFTLPSDAPDAALWGGLKNKLNAVH
jgi:hypothetical protein